jgi:PAS domain S-box-containing protein
MHKAWDNGENIPVEVTLQRTETSKGAVLVCWARDMREYYKLLELQQTEQKANEMTRLILNSAPLCVTIWDDKGNLIEANSQTVEFFGVEKYEYENRFAELWVEIQPCGTPAIQKSMELTRQIIANGSMRYEWAYRLPSGKEVIFDVIGVRIERDGKTLILEYYQDLSEIRAAQEKERELEVKLQEQEMNERIRVMFDAAPIVIEYWSREYEPIDCNLTALNYYGLANKEEYSSRMSAFFELEHPNTREWRKNLDNIFQVGFGQFEFNDFKPNGEVTFLEVQAVRLKLENEDVIISYAQDVTQIKESERAKLHALEKERETYELMSLLIESSPVFMEIWHDGQLVDCNEQCVKLFGIENKAEFITKYEELSPPYQPCGTPSMEKSAFLVGETMRKGYTRTPWVHLGYTATSKQAKKCLLKLFLFY